MEIMGEGEFAKICPEWIRCNIADDDRTARIGRGAAGSDTETDGDALDRVVVIAGQARCRPLGQMLAIVRREQDGRQQLAARRLFHEKHDITQHIFQRAAKCDA